MLFGSRDVEILSLRGDANRIFAKEVGCGVWGVAPNPPDIGGVGCGVWGVSFCVRQKLTPRSERLKHETQRPHS